MNCAGTQGSTSTPKTKQGYELQLGTNCLGHHLLTKLLTPLLVKTATEATPGSVRVVWLSSNATSMSPPGGILWKDINYEKTSQGVYMMTTYGQSKTGNFFQAYGFKQVYPFNESRVLSVSVHPGALKTSLFRYLPGWVNWLINVSVLDS